MLQGLLKGPSLGHIANFNYAVEVILSTVDCVLPKEFFKWVHYKRGKICSGTCNKKKCEEACSTSCRLACRAFTRQIPCLFFFSTPKQSGHMLNTYRYVMPSWRRIYVTKNPRWGLHSAATFGKVYEQRHGMGADISHCVWCRCLRCRPSSSPHLRWAHARGEQAARNFFCLKFELLLRHVAMQHFSGTIGSMHCMHCVDQLQITRLAEDPFKKKVVLKPELPENYSCFLRGTLAEFLL